MPATRSLSLPGVAAALALLLTSCDDPTTAPSSLSTSARVVSRGDQAIPNSVKYRDEGHRPATGRSGSATLTVSALLGKSGATVVEVAAGSIGGTGSPMLAKAQLNASTPSGEHIFTVNDNHLSARTAAFAFNGLIRNDRLRVHANVRGVDGARTNVVVVDQIIKLRPDVAVTDVQAPTEAWTHTPTIVGATLRELNGDVGARMTCRLELDGVVVDSAANAWVDAGDAVSCSFAFMLEEAGEHTLTVRATSVQPGDWDGANNAASVVVQVGRDIPLSYTATAKDDSVRIWRLNTATFRSVRGWTSTRIDTMSESGRAQSSYLTAFTRDTVSMLDEPVRNVRLSQRTGNIVVHAATYDALPAEQITTGSGWIQACVTRSGGAIVASFTLCSRRETVDGVTSTYTNVIYQWRATAITYRSDGYQGLTCYVGTHDFCVPWLYTWTWNYASPRVEGTMLSFGSEFAFDVEFYSGVSRFRAAATVPLAFTHTRTHQAPSCQTEYLAYLPGGPAWPPALPDGSPGELTRCLELFSELWRLSGSVSGP